MAARVAIPDFQLANPLYAGAAVTFYTVDSGGVSTGTPASLYAAPSGATTLSNPQRLDSEGKFERPVYIQVPVTGEVTGANVESHSTGVHGLILNDAAGLAASTLASGIFGMALLAALPTTDVSASDRVEVQLTGASDTITSLGTGANRLRIITTENKQTFQTSGSLIVPDGEFISKPGRPFVAVSDQNGVWTIGTGSASYKQRGTNTKAKLVSERLRTQYDFIDWLPAIIDLDTIADFSITTDLSTYWNNMVSDLVNARGGRVELPAGLIPIANTICQSGMRNITFQGQGGQDLTYAANSGTVIKFTGTGAGRIIDMRDHRGVWWRDLQVVYTSNLFTGTGFDQSTSFQTGCASGFERVQGYQVTGTGHTLAQWFYTKNNVDVTYRNCYVSHANYGWMGVLATDVGADTNMIRLEKCTSIGLKVAAVHNPIIGWTIDTHNFEPSDSGAPCAITTSGAFDIKDLAIINCKCADSTANGTWYKFDNNTFNLKIIGGGILTLSGTATGVYLGGTFHGATTIQDVEWDGLNIGINYAAATVGYTRVISNEFLSTVTPVSGMANCDAASLFLANTPNTANRALRAGYGGTDNSSYTAGDILYASGATTLLKRGVGAANTFLKSIAGLPDYGAILPADVASFNPIYIAARATAVNCNSVADTTLTLSMPAGITNYRLQALVLKNPSGSLVGAQFGLFTAAGGGGTGVITPTAFAISTAAANTNNNAQFAGPSITAVLNAAQLFFRITTALGSAGTVEVQLQIQPLQ